MQLNSQGIILTIVENKYDHASSRNGKFVLYVNLNHSLVPWEDKMGLV